MRLTVVPVKPGGQEVHRRCQQRYLDRALPPPMADNAAAAISSPATSPAADNVPAHDLRSTSLWIDPFPAIFGDTDPHAFKKPRFSMIAYTKLVPLERKIKNISGFLSRRCLLVAYRVKGRHERHRRKPDDQGDCGALAMFAGARSKRPARESPRCACPRSSGHGLSENSSSALAS